MNEQQRNIVDEGFPDGSITKIIFENFLTYEYMEMLPGPNLNVIIGPNGAGKSTVICGICLALGGTPKLLGRSDIVAAYVRYGSQKGSVKVFIRDSKREKDRTLSIVIHRSGAASDYFVDDKKVVLKHLREIVASYDIQIDNPCTFLAQDKVKCFAEQYPPSLLENTERRYLNATAIGDERVQILQEKEKELEETKKSMLPIRSHLEQQKTVSEKRIGEEMKAKYELLEVREKVEKLLAAESVDESVMNAKKDYERSKKEYDEWEEKLDVARKECNLLEEKLTAAEREFASIEKENLAVKKEYLEWNTKEEELDKQKSVLDSRIAGIDFDKRGVQKAIDIVQQSFRRKFAIFKGNGKEMKCGEAWQWYESHKEKFRHPVFVPLLFISLVSDEAAVYLENILARRDLLMFIFRCKEDEMLLTDKRHPWKINSCIINDDEISRFQNREAISPRLCSLGFSCMASDLYTAPDPVKAYLNSVASLHKIPIGTQATEYRLDEVCEVLKNSHRLFLSKSLRVRISISRYSGNLSVRTEALRTSLRLLIVHTVLSRSNSPSIAELEKQFAELKELENEMRLSRERIAQTEKNIAQGRERCRKKMDAFIKKRDARNIVSNQLRSKIARLVVLKAIESDKPDLNVAAQTFRKAKNEIIAGAFERVEMIARLMERRKFFIQNALFTALASKNASKELDLLQKRMRRFEEEYEYRSDAVSNMQTSVKMAKKTIEEEKQRLYAAIGVAFSPPNEALDALETLRTNFVDHGIPNTEEDVKLELEREKGKLDALHSEGEKKDIEYFENLTLKRNSCANELNSKRKTVCKWDEKVKGLLDEWLPQVESMIAKLNQYFSSFFENIGCAGKICLEKPENKFDILNYGILVTARFREGERLRQLTHQTQSGGERSVTTMLYILALQKLSVVPFRCVDEINQG
uniref:Structural maintenance of chromosomes protein 5 n=1 Tax=Setaria digitata TaxID=48799 RepID=A0A915PDP2_9BILA